MDSFADSRRSVWERLTEIVVRIETQGLRALSREELDEFGRLYRQASSHLAQARTERRDPRLVEYLNQLVGRAHAHIYRRRRERGLRPVRLFFQEVPRAFRRRAAFLLISTLLSVGVATGSYFLVRANEDWAGKLGFGRVSQVMDEFAAKEGPPGRYFADTQQMMGAAGMSTFLWTHNLTVGLSAFAVGIALGIGTIYLLTANGIMLGVFLGVAANRGCELAAWGIIAPHGVTELSAIFACGGAGLMLGYALIDPKDLTRRDALVIAARDAGLLMLGIAPMFLVAGFIEGTLSPSSLSIWGPSESRIIFGVAVAAVVLTWAFFGDLLFLRQRAEPAVPVPW